MSEKPGEPITLVFPVAGGDAQAGFRGFDTAGGETLIQRSLRSFRPYLDRIGKIHYVVLEEHQARFDIARRLAADIPDLPFELIALPSPTRGPAESVAQGVVAAGIAGPAIVCDIDHRLDPAPLFAAIAARPGDCLVSLWPLAGEQLKRWSVACVADSRIAKVAERRLPDAAGSFFGVIGCYYFPEIGAVAQACLAGGLRRFSDYFNQLAAEGAAAHGLKLETAEFFGDRERIRALEDGAGRRGTIFCDIDGTLIVHQDRPDYSQPPQLLPGAREKLRGWIAEGWCVVLCTARAAADEPRIVAMLQALEIPYQHLLTGLPAGARIVINDRKPHDMFTAQAASLEIARDAGIAALQLPPGRALTVLRRFEGGSFAETLLVAEAGKTFVRKRAAREGKPDLAPLRLREQYRSMGRLAQMAPGLAPALLGEEDNSHEYFYDMEYLDGHRQLAEWTAGERAAALDRLFDRLGAEVYCHRSHNRAAAELWFRHHLDSKIRPRIESLAGHDALRPLLTGDGVTIDGRHCPSLTRLLERMGESDVLPHLVPRFLSLVHGDLTFQNILLRADGDLKLIDMEAPDSFEAVELDLGKLFQSTHSQYESWWRAGGRLCEDAGPCRIALNFTPAPPDPQLLDAVRRRWAAILDCSGDEVDLKGGFYLGLHLVRMVPFRLQTGLDPALYALSTALLRLDDAIAQAGRARAPRRSGRVEAAA